MSLPEVVAALSAEPWLLTLTITLFSSLVLLKILKRWKYGKINPPPGPPGLPIIGNLHQVGSHPHRNFAKLAEEYGPIMSIRLGSVPAVVVSTAEMAKEVLKIHDVECCSRPAAPSPHRLFYGSLDVAFSPYGDRWRETRKLFKQEFFTSTIAQNCVRASRVSWMDKLIKHLEKAYPNPINLDDQIYTFADGIIGTAAFGNIYASNELNQEFRVLLNGALDLLGGFSAEDFYPSLIGKCVDRLTGFHARRERIFRNLDSFLDIVIKKHIDEPKKDDDYEDLVYILLRILSGDAEQPNTFKFTRDHVKALLMETFIAGISTVTDTVLWSMTEIVKEPRVLKKLQEELRSTLGKRERVAEADLGQLKYLKLVVKEAFRMHPPGPLLLPRESISQMKIGKYDIVPRTRIFVNVFAIGRDPNLWDNPDKFFPERFENSDIDFKGQNYELLPFGGGRRICLGMNMGTTSVEFILANLLYCFDWKTPPGMQVEDISMEEEGGLGFRRKIPLSLVPVRYT